MPQRFLTTEWSIVLTASQPGETQVKALEELCRTYWYPLYCYVRRRGHSPEDAQDLTQEFFARLLEKNWLSEIKPEGGRFRSFLLTALSRFLANAYDRATAVKRGGGREILSLDQAAAEERYAAEPKTNETPERLFEKRWAWTVLDLALNCLRTECTSSGKDRPFELLHPFLSREATAGEYSTVAETLAMSPGAVGVAVHRLRHRYRELVREQIAATLGDRTRVEEEMNYLVSLLRE